MLPSHRTYTARLEPGCHLRSQVITPVTLSNRFQRFKSKGSDSALTGKLYYIHLFISWTMFKPIESHVVFSFHLDYYQESALLEYREVRISLGWYLFPLKVIKSLRTYFWDITEHGSLLYVRHHDLQMPKWMTNPLNSLHSNHMCVNTYPNEALPGHFTDCNSWLSGQNLTRRRSDTKNLSTMSQWWTGWFLSFFFEDSSSTV